MSIASQIGTYIRPPDGEQSTNYAISILNQTFTSLDRVQSLNESIASQKEQVEVYQEQLDSSEVDVDKLKVDTRNAANEQLFSAQELSLLRHSLADELHGLSNSLVSEDGDGPTLLEEIEVLHRKLKELESVKEYVQVIHMALQLSEQASEQIEKDSASALITEASVKNYIALQGLVGTIEKECQKANVSTGQSIKLSTFLKELVVATWASMKDILARKLLSAAEELGWPMPVDYLAGKPDKRETFETTFSNMLRFQIIAKSVQADTQDIANNGLYPLQALIRPVALRFKYHFEGPRQTNRVDKPEWYFSHVMNIAHEQRVFMETIVQRLLQTTVFRDINAWHEFTRLLFPLIFRKIKRSMPSLLPHPPLLAHTIYQALAFDDALREAGFSLMGTLDDREDKNTWTGIGDWIIDNKAWFEAWLEGERKFSENQYNEIIHSPDAWQIIEDSDEEAASEQDFRPTISARRVKVLIEQITDRYKALPQFLHKTRFLITVQVPILELYHTRISDSLDAFETLSSFLVRAVPGSLAGQVTQGRDPKSMTSGTDGSQRLVKAYISAKWMAKALATWGEELFYLELWHEICEKSSLRKRVADVAVLPDPDIHRDEGTIFDELVVQYESLAERAEAMLLKQITGEIEADLKPHFTQRHASSPVDLDDPIVSQTLLGPIARLSAHLGLFRKTLPAPTVVSLYRKICSDIASHILQRQVLQRGRSRMSYQEGRIVLEEANLWVEACRIAMSGSVRRADLPWKKLLDAGRLLSLNGDAFEQVAHAVRLGDEEEGKKASEMAGVSDLNFDDIMQILSIRDDFLGR